MNKLLPTCREYSKDHKIAVASENGKKFIINNASRFVIDKYKIDGCLPLPAGKRRCDFLFLTNGQPPTAYFVELKGGDIKSALNQLCDTIEYLKSDLADYQYKARIVSSGNVPKLEVSRSHEKLYKLIKGSHNYTHAHQQKLFRNDLNKSYGTLQYGPHAERCGVRKTKIRPVVLKPIL